MAAAGRGRMMISNNEDSDAILALLSLVSQEKQITLIFPTKEYTVPVAGLCNKDS